MVVHGDRLPRDDQESPRAGAPRARRRAPLRCGYPKDLVHLQKELEESPDPAPHAAKFLKSTKRRRGADDSLHPRLTGLNSLKNRQELLDLVWRDLLPVLLELRALDLQEPRVDVLTQSLLQELGTLDLPDRFAEVDGQCLDTHLLALVDGEVVEVALHRLGELVAFLDAFEPCMQERREAQVDVRRRVRTPELRALGLSLARVVDRHPHQRRAVAAAPGQVDRSLVAGDSRL